MSINNKLAKARLVEWLVEWLIKFGTDWVEYKAMRERGFQFEVGRLECMGYLEYKDNGEGIYSRLTDKSLQLLENDREE